jgi:hypothetical protein
VELIFKMQVLTIAMNIGVAMYVVIKMILFQLPPSLLTVVFLGTSWALMVIFNPVWKELWCKWTQK